MLFLSAMLPVIGLTDNAKVTVQRMRASRVAEAKNAEKIYPQN